MATINDLEGLFDDHPSLDASLQDFEPGSSELAPSPRFQRLMTSPHGLYPSHHSGFRSEDSDSDHAESLSGGGYSPPAWRRAKNGTRSSGFWDRGDMVGGESSARNSRESSPEYEDADDGGNDATLAAATRIRLPTGSLSPEKRRSPSPDPYPTGGGDFGNNFGAAIKQEDQELNKAISPEAAAAPENSNNYIRFAVRAEVQHRTEPFEAAFAWLRSKIDLMTKSRTSLISSIVIALLSISALQALFQPGTPLPVPDLVKVAGLAKAFEPLIYYSENGVSQINDLQATGIAVWDLGESVRSTNMTSAPIIVKSLDDLSESLKTLAIDLTKFFANVDGDVDGILIVMDWAKRELSQISQAPPSPISSAFDNVHTFLSRIGILATPAGTPTALGALSASIFGNPPSLRTRQTLHRTFHEFLSVLEESIDGELQHSTSLFRLFEAIDQQFLNLARTVIRESDQQERLESELLSSLWTRVLGANAGSLRKYERNKQLLVNVREKTVRSKSVLVDHNGKLMTLKANLEMLRKKLVSPLVRSNDSSTLSLESQIRGLEGVEVHLRQVRERQKGKLMEIMYGAGGRRVQVSRDDGWGEIDGRRD